MKICCTEDIPSVPQEPRAAPLQTVEQLLEWRCHKMEDSAYCQGAISLHKVIEEQTTVVSSYSKQRSKGLDRYDSFMDKLFPIL
jgi:endo-beta-N-acetylglucosaminidase D